MKIIKSTPKKLTPEEIYNTKNICALCKCPLPLNYGHIFKKTDFEKGELIIFKCTKCKEECGIYNL